MANTGYHLIRWENSNDIVFLSSSSVASASWSFEQFGVDGRGWFVAVGGGGGFWGLCWEEGLCWEVVLGGGYFGSSVRRGKQKG